jgi:hypothetical protein
MMSPGGTLTAQACNLTKKVNKAEELTYLSTNIDLTPVITAGVNFSFVFKVLVI